MRNARVVSLVIVIKVSLIRQVKATIIIYYRSLEII